MRPRQPRRQLAPGQVSELTVIDRDGSNRTVIYETAELIEAPNWSPDGKWLVFNADGRLFRISPDGADGPHRINTAPVENLNNDHVISPDGATIHLSAGGHLYRVPFSGGAPVRVSNEHEAARDFGHYLHGISPDGATLSYVGLEKGPDGKTIFRIYTIPAGGGPDTVLTDGACPVDGPEFSADGQWIYFNSEAAATRPGHAQVFRMRPDGSGREQLTGDERVNWFPHCAPDGTIAYVSFPPGTTGHPADKQVVLRVMDADGSNSRDIATLFGGQGTINVNSWAPDSLRLAYVAYPMAG